MTDSPQGLVERPVTRALQLACALRNVPMHPYDREAADELDRLDQENYDLAAALLEAQKDAEHARAHLATVILCGLHGDAERKAQAYLDDAARKGDNR